MARFRCSRFTCGSPPAGFVFHGDMPQCPKCGAVGAPAVHELTDVHFLALGRGPLSGPFGAFHVACEPDRPHLGLHAGDGFAASDHPEAVTCPSCRGTEVFQQFVKALFPKLWLQLQAEKEGRKLTVDLGGKPDCGCG